LNGVFWVRILETVPKGKLIENLYDVGKTSVKKEQRRVEAGLLFPLLRGRDTRRWIADPSAWIILPQDPETREGIPEADMRRRFTKTFEYLILFQEQLRKRSGYRKYFRPTDPFYSVYNVGPYTMTPWKVVWREQSSRIQAAVVPPSEGKKVVIPDHKLMLVGCDGPGEAYYLAAMLNSAPAEVVIGAYVLSTSTSTHILEHVRIPKYEPTKALHARLAELSKQAHEMTAGAKAGVRDVEREIDESAAKVFGITRDQLTALWRVVEGEAGESEEDRRPLEPPEED
jgi:hypothetical protein